MKLITVLSEGTVKSMYRLILSTYLATCVSWWKFLCHLCTFICDLSENSALPPAAQRLGFGGQAGLCLAQDTMEAYAPWLNVRCHPDKPSQGENPLHTLNLSNIITKQPSTGGAGWVVCPLDWATDWELWSLPVLSTENRYRTTYLSIAPEKIHISKLKRDFYRLHIPLTSSLGRELARGATVN